MTVLVSVETVLLVVLVVLVAGLLRSHAELLRRLGPESGDVGADVQGSDRNTVAAPAVGAVAGVSAPSSGAHRDPAAPAPALSGSTPTGDAVSLSFEGASAPTLLAFLSTGCSTCAGFWEELGEHRLPPGVRTVIVTRGAEREQPARLRSLARPETPVVMSSAAWQHYGVPGAPYFVLVDGSVQGEGVATTWRALSSLVADAIEDRRAVQLAAGGGTRTVDETLAAAGIGPDHPTLYPAGGRRP